MRKVFENRLAIIGFLLVFASMLGLAPSSRMGVRLRLQRVRCRVWRFAARR